MDENSLVVILTSSIALAVSLLVSVISWSITSKQNRDQAKFTKLLEHRIEMLLSFIPVFLSMQYHHAPFLESNVNQELVQSRILFQLYGTEDEIELMNLFCDSIERQDIDEANEHYKKLVSHVQNQIRLELGLKSR